MPKANLDRCWSYAEQGHARPYGPGETEIPEGLYQILSEKGYLEPSSESPDVRVLDDLGGIGPDLVKKLNASGYQTPDDLHAASDEQLLAIDGLGKAKLRQIRADL